MDRIAEYSGVPDPINDKTKRLAMVLGKEMTGRILASLYTNPYQSASDIARGIHIHIATAQKYLVDMRHCGLLESRWRRNSNRPTEEYWLAKKKFDIQVDLEQIPKRNDLERRAAEIFIKKIESDMVAFDTDIGHRKITEIILMDGQENGRIGQRIKLDDIEGRFTWHLPSHADPPLSVLELAERAGIGPDGLPQIIELVERLATIELNDSMGRIGIIERTGVIDND
jgi:hypothetical protein